MRLTRIEKQTYGRDTLQRPVCASFESAQEPEEKHSVCLHCGWMRKRHARTPAPTPATVRHLFEEANNVALAIVETSARAILRAHPCLDEFIMGMGIWSFTTKEGESHMPGFYTTPTYITNSRLSKFIGEWDDYLKLTGSPMRFTAEGRKITNW